MIIRCVDSRNDGPWSGWHHQSNWESNNVSNALMFYPCRRSEVYRFFTLAFAHRGYTHLFVNCLLCLWFGLILEANQKGWKSSLRVAAIFFSGVIFGSLMFSLMEPEKSNQGSSCGVYALIGGNIAYILLNVKKEMGSLHTVAKKFWNPFQVPMRILILFVFLVFDASFAITSDRDKVSHSGHFIGATSGFLVGMVVVEKSVKEKWERYVEKFLAVLIPVVFISLVSTHLVLTYVPVNGDKYMFPNETHKAIGGKCE